MTDKSSGQKQNGDETLDRLIRLAGEQDDPGFQRPATETIQAYLLGFATPEQKKTMRTAMLRSTTFLHEIRELAEELEHIESPEVQRELAELPVSEKANLHPFVRSRLIMKLEALAGAAAAAADQAVQQVADFLQGLNRAGIVPRELVPVGVTVRGGPQDISGMPDAWDHVRRALMKGDEVRCEIPDLGLLTIKRDVPTKSLMFGVEPLTGVKTGRLHFWREEAGKRAAIGKFDEQTGAVVVPLADIKPGLMLGWQESD